MLIRYGKLQPACNIIKDVIVLHCKKRLSVFPSLAGMSLTKLSLAGKNLTARESLVIDNPAGLITFFIV
jgi:hypothetical protein